MEEIKSSLDEYFDKLDDLSNRATQKILSNKKTYQDAYKELRHAKFSSKSGTALKTAFLDQVMGNIGSKAFDQTINQ
ncbi:MAG: hypothetical protein ABF619_07495 [Oenococcus oeni]